MIGSKTVLWINLECVIGNMFIAIIRAIENILFQLHIEVIYNRNMSVLVLRDNAVAYKEISHLLYPHSPFLGLFDWSI